MDKAKLIDIGIFDSPTGLIIKQRDYCHEVYQAEIDRLEATIRTLAALLEGEINAKRDLLFRANKAEAELAELKRRVLDAQNNYSSDKDAAHRLDVLARQLREEA